MAGRKRKIIVINDVICKPCSRCKEVKNILDFSVSNKQKGYRSSFCKDCTKEKNRLLYAKNPQKFHESNSRWAKKNPQKRRAHEHLMYAIEHGHIYRPEFCSDCGKSCIPDGHHWRGYEPEHWLNVQWLCRSCHKKADNTEIIGV